MQQGVKMIKSKQQKDNMKGQMTHEVLKWILMLIIFAVVIVVIFLLVQGLPDAVEKITTITEKII